jgi:hypothetical protein
MRWHMLDLFQMTAERIHNVGAGWKWCHVSAIDVPPGFIKVRGAIPIGQYKSGKRKGHPKWPKDDQLQTLWMKKTDMDAMALQWEVEQQKCHKCEGSGEVVVSSHVVHGKTFGKCKRCKGSGKPTSA